MSRIALILSCLVFPLIPLREGAVSPDDPLPAELVARTEARSPEDERAGFHLPPGFEIQLVASDPDIHKPMNIAFDDRGRLWVTETIEYPFPAKDGTIPRDTVKILSDIGPDGRAKTVSTFVNALNIPIGILPLPGGREALVHAIPTIDRHTDKDNDGKADAREIAYKTYGSRDTHGMTNAFTWGFDGWIYACHGFNNESEVQGKDDQKLLMQSGNTYRMRADGSHAEAFTRGQVNPFGLCFDPLGNLYSADCHSKPVYQLLRGACYPSFGKPSDGLGFGPEMVQHDHGSTAISGVVYYAADNFPKPYRDTVFIGNVVTNRINHDTIDWKGSTAKGILQPDFLSSDDPWFRPVDLKLGPDGAIYIADFYNRIIGHYEVSLTHPGRDRERGRIWRIVYRGEDGKQAVPPLPDFTKFDIETLVKELESPNFARRIFAANQLVARGGETAVSAVNTSLATCSPTGRVHGLWVLDRLGALNDDVLAQATHDEDRTVRTHASKIIAERAAPKAAMMDALKKGLSDDDAFVKRASADALARHPSSGNVRPLLDARHAVNAKDEALRHVIRIALRDQYLDAAKWPLADDASYSEDDLRALADVALGAPNRDSAKFLIAFLQKYPEDKGQRFDQMQQIARYGDNETDASLLAFAKAQKPEDLALQAEIVKRVHRGFQERGAAWVGPMLDWSIDVSSQLLKQDRAEALALGLELTETLRLAQNRAAISNIVRSSDRTEPQRIAAVNAIAAIDPATAAEPLGTILTDLSAPITLREAVALALAKTNHETARAKLVEALPIAPDRLQTSIAAALAGNRLGAEALLDTVSKGKASARLLQERAVKIWLDGSGIPDLATKIATLTEGFAPADARVAELLAQRRAGFSAAKIELGRGSEIFKKNCAICHQLGGEGAKVGPQLDGIGVRGNERITEDILDPNRNVDQSFRQTTLALKDGRVLSGLVLREEGDVIVIADSQGKEIRIEKGTVDERKTSLLSPMPADLAEKLSEPEFYDLIAYLLSKKAK